ncbi:MAG: TniB family NTP-binding protein, partial [Stenotrophobium sp.]
MADLVIIYPALDTLYNEARWLIMEQRGSRARGIFICGNNGSGKTSILKTLCREFPLEALQLNNTHQRRVLAVSMSGVRTTKAMLNRILVA